MMILKVDKRNISKPCRITCVRGDEPSMRKGCDTFHADLWMVAWEDSFPPFRMASTRDRDFSRGFFFVTTLLYIAFLLDGNGIGGNKEIR
jgi:hypothetical protein